MRSNRRVFLKSTVGSLLVAGLPVPATAQKPDRGLTNEIGITTGSFMRHLTVDPKPGKLRLLDLPKIMRDELNMRVIDLMTATLASFEPAYVGDLRERAEKADCIITNLKMNQKGLDMASAVPAMRTRALDEYKRTIDVAEQLGSNGEHLRYDLKRCFQIGWNNGFRGPWCLEHFNSQLDALLRDFARLRDMLNQWVEGTTATK